MSAIGGSVHHHGSEEMCYSNGTYAYHLGCLVWRDDLRSLPADVGNPVHFGHLGHVAVKRGNNMLVIVGGFRGTLSGDVIAVRLSSAIVDLTAVSNRSNTSSTHTSSHCSNLTKKECQEDPECVLCEVSGDGLSQCLHYLQRSACASPTSVMACSQICSAAHRSCAGCLSMNAWWPEDAPQWCDWCVIDQKCYPASLSHDQCRASLSLASSHQYWFGNTSLLSSVDQCQKDDVPPGLTTSCFLTTSRPPTSLGDADFEQLDRVSRTETAEVVFSEPLTLQKESNEWTICRAEGFIRPVPFQSSSLPPFYTMQLSAYAVDQGQVRLRVKVTTRDNQIVQNITGAATKPTVFSSMLPVASNHIFPHYYIAIYGAYEMYNVKAAGRVTVKWNGYSQSFNGTHVRCCSVWLPSFYVLLALALFCCPAIVCKSLCLCLTVSYLHIWIPFLIFLNKVF